VQATNTANPIAHFGTVFGGESKKKTYSNCRKGIGPPKQLGGSGGKHRSTMKLRINSILLLALIVGLLAGSVPCKGRVLFQASATASSSDGTTEVASSTSDSGSSSTARAISTGGAATSTATATGGGKASASAASGSGSASSIVEPGEGTDDLTALIVKIYEAVARRLENRNDPKAVAEREVTIQRLSIASVWGEVLGSVGLGERGAECDDIEELATTQSQDFSEALIDGLEAARGDLSELAQDEIRSTIDSQMKEAFEAAADAACSVSGFSLGSRVKFGQAVVGPVSDVIVIATKDEDISFDRASEAEPVEEKPEEEEIEDGESINGSSTAITRDGETSRCSRWFTVCCLDRKILSGKCDCLGGRCDAVLEDGIWKDQSGEQCSCT